LTIFFKNKKYIYYKNTSFFSIKKCLSHSLFSGGFMKKYFCFILAILSILSVFSIIVTAKEKKDICAIGDCINDKGTMNYADGRVYEGQWKNGKFHGQGTLTRPDGRRYEGQWKEGYENGQGKWTSNDGNIYVGQWKDGKKNGFGTITLPDGRKYSGQWKDGYWNGQGALYNSNGKIDKKGNWVNGYYVINNVKYDSPFIYSENGSCMSGDCMNGKGIMTWPNGSKYEGKWENGRRKGSGTFTFQDGSKYEGKWENDKENGNGTKTLPDGSEYDGEWLDGKQNGKGTMKWATGDKYEGQWKDGKEHGKGTMKWASGDKYEGQWKDGLENGYGKKKWYNGDKYEGQWKDGKRHGRGKMLYSTMNEYTGQWENGHENGEGTMIYSNGDTYKGQWKDGKRHGMGVMTTYYYRQEQRIDSNGNRYMVNILPRASRDQRGIWENDICIGNNSDKSTANENDNRNANIKKTHEESITVFPISRPFVSPAPTHTGEYVKLLEIANCETDNTASSDLVHCLKYDDSFKNGGKTWICHWNSGISDGITYNGTISEVVVTYVPSNEEKELKYYFATHGHLRVIFFARNYPQSTSSAPLSGRIWFFISSKKINGIK